MLMLRRIQDGGGHLFACTDASVNSQDGDHASLFLMVLRYKIQDGARAPSLKLNVATAFSHNILHTLYFFVISAALPSSMTLTRLTLVLAKCCVIF